MQRTVTTAKAIRGTLGVSANKSISHRAAILNAIADGEAIIEDFQRGADCLATISCLRRLGATCRWRGDSRRRTCARFADRAMDEASRRALRPVRAAVEA